MRVLAGVVAAGMTACTLFTPLDTDLTSGSEPAPGAVDADDGGVAGSEAGSADASLVDDGAGPCDPSVRAVPVRAFEASPELGLICGIENILAEDGKVTGLDRGDNELMLDGKSVTGCVGVEFARAVDRVVIRASPTANACGSACSSNCGTGHDMAVFAGSTPASLTHVRGVTLTATTLTDYTLDLAAGNSFRVVVVCRTGWGDSRDDVAVDAIHGRCL